MKTKTMLGLFASGLASIAITGLSVAAGTEAAPGSAAGGAEGAGAAAGAGAVAGTVAVDAGAPAGALGALSPSIYGASLKALVILFVLAVLIESALAVIFNWRLFLQVFNGRGVKTVIAVAVSALVVWTFNIDVVWDLLKVYGGGTQNADAFISKLITAFILAGGSGGVYNILVALGYRNAKAAEAVQSKPPKNMAWVSVRVTRDKAVGPIVVKLAQSNAVTAASPLPIAGVIRPGSFWRSAWWVFFRDPSRFPPSGGQPVVPGFEYRLQVDAVDENKGKIACPIDGTYAFADGAIVDLEVTL